jgi:hypothetical protein
MEPGIADVLGKRDPEPQVTRVLWRMQGPSKVMVARIERHPFGRELIVAFEAGDDVVETRFERVNFSLLEQRGNELRELLLEKGWTDVRANC